ncbi:DUF2254 domain-containing protein [Labedella endophytica]|uniref:DUF2254 domain-containing protein n=1 Tax=Labedella endophytica TaxID=1523160 RepID=A0A433JMM8_9MICO|nr:DUF2254 domain-containing protein [Labedella endophytica]RUQ96783.1 DUF2254 domain-containing protein [Labedella endophytica]
MTSGIVAALRRIGRKVWMRAALYTAASVIFALAAGVIATLFPFRIAVDLGQDSVGTILQIIASSMLTVTTFSLTAMVTAYSSATTTATPRATQLLIEDRTSQNALSTFVGGFTFSLVGIIALSTGYYGEQGRTILFFGTLVMIAVIVVTLLRWIAHLSTFGRMADVIDRLESAASGTLTTHAESPALGGRSYSDLPRGLTEISGDASGYVTFVDLPLVERVAARCEVELYVTSMPGETVDPRTPLVAATGSIDDEARESLTRAFRIQPHRDFEQDPRLGVIALAEIGSRALSPATNDPGTAIEVIAALRRVFDTALACTPDEEVSFEHVFVRPVGLSELVTDAFRPLARDGAGIVEVQIRLQKCLASLAACDPTRAPVFRSMADHAYERARDALDTWDVADLERVYRARNA